MGNSPAPRETSFDLNTPTSTSAEIVYTPSTPQLPQPDVKLHQISLTKIVSYLIRVHVPKHQIFPTVLITTLLSFVQYEQWHFDDTIDYSKHFNTPKSK